MQSICIPEYCLMQHGSACIFVATSNNRMYCMWLNLWTSTSDVKPSLFEPWWNKLQQTYSRMPAVGKYTIAHVRRQLSLTII